MEAMILGGSRSGSRESPGSRKGREGTSGERKEREGASGKGGSEVGQQKERVPEGDKRKGGSRGDTVRGGDLCGKSTAKCASTRGLEKSAA